MRRMQIYRVFRLFLLLLFASSVGACASEAPPALPTPSIVPQAVVLPITAVLSEPQRWSGQELTIVAPLALQGDDRVLLADAESTGELATIVPAQAIWLAEAPPEAIRSAVLNGNTILKIRGKLSPPGAYGRDQRFPYQISAAQIETLQAERTTIANLAQNPHSLDRILLSVEGTLLAEPSSALLTDQVSEGGVPTGLHQIKLRGISPDRSLLDRMQSSGEVRWGKVQMIGWWQDGTLTPFKTRLLE
jgi:hypothetical protein